MRRAILNSSRSKSPESSASASRKICLHGPSHPADLNRKIHQHLTRVHNFVLENFRNKNEDWELSKEKTIVIWGKYDSYNYTIQILNQTLETYLYALQTSLFYRYSNLRHFRKRHFIHFGAKCSCAVGLIDTPQRIHDCFGLLVLVTLWFAGGFAEKTLTKCWFKCDINVPVPTCTWYNQDIHACRLHWLHVLQIKRHLVLW